MHFQITEIISILLFFVHVSISQRTSVEGRYLRPPSQDRPCNPTIRCSESGRDRYGDDKYPDDYKDVEKSRPPVRTQGDRPGVLSDSRPGSEYKPDVSSGRRDEDDYKIKPVPAASEYDSAKSRDDYRPKPKDDFVPKPVDGDYSRKPDEYDSKPALRDEYDTKPPIRDEYKPKPVIREEYNPKPAIREEYNPKPAVRDEYNPKPAVRDEYNPKPAVRDEYNPKPAIREEYNPKPAVREEYNPKPAVRDEYNPKPAVRDEYKPKPAVRDEYNPRPVDKDEYSPRPVDKDEYNPRPVDKDEYIPRPVDRDDYGNKPTGGGYYYPKPVDPVKDDDRPYQGGGGGGGGGDSKVWYDSKEDDYNDDDNDKDKSIAAIENENCICVPYYQCKDGHIVTDGAGIIDARRRPQPDEDLPLDGKFKPPSCGPFHVCCNTPESSTVKPYEHRCGVRNPSGINSRILSPSNKGEADFGEWPWQAAVLKSEGSVNIFQCGGVLIDKYHVLTVAHCVFHLYKFNDYPLKVRLGEWDTQTTSEFLAHEDYKVSKITIHPEYRNTSLWNDIAILRLQEAVLFAPHIDTICLPKYDEIFSGQNCVVTGWGKDSYKGGTFSNVMKEVALQVIDNYNCEEMLRKTRLGRFFQLYEGFICAGGEHGLDSCKGDGGGPLVCYRKDRSYALAGLVSWGIDCGQPGVPGVYVKVQKYLDWISKNTGVELQDYWPKA